MSTQQEIPTELKASGVHRPGPGDPSVEADISTKTGTILVAALIVIVAGIFFSALFANALYRSSLKDIRESHGNPSVGGAAIKARTTSATRAAEGGSVEDEDGNVRHFVPVAQGAALLLASPNTLAGSSKHQIAKDGATADIPELPSYLAVIDPEAAALAAAEEEADAAEEGEEQDEADADAADQDGAEDADDSATEDEDGDDGDSEEDAE